MRRKWEAGKPIVSQIVPDFVSDLGFAVTYDKKALTAIMLSEMSSTCTVDPKTHFTAPQIQFFNFGTL